MCVCVCVWLKQSEDIFTSVGFANEKERFLDNLLEIALYQQSLVVFYAWKRPCPRYIYMCVCSFYQLSMYSVLYSGDFSHFEISGVAILYDVTSPSQKQRQLIIISSRPILTSKICYGLHFEYQQGAQILSQIQSHALALSATQRCCLQYSIKV